MSLTFDEPSTPTSDDPSLPLTSMEVVTRTPTGPRLRLLVPATVLVVAAVALTTVLRPTDNHAGHDHEAGTAQTNVNASAEGGYIAERVEASVLPPLPAAAPVNNFDPKLEVANFDASVVAGVVEGALVYATPADPGNIHWTDLPTDVDDLRALSTDGTRAALLHFQRDAAGAITATDVYVADRNANTLETHNFSGQVEPEAFSTDGETLFVIDHKAGHEPGTYRIRPLDLGTGRLGTMVGPSKAPLDQDMNGAGARQLWGDTDQRLYTLYIRQVNHTHGDDHPETSGFVHVLDLDEEWAVCLDLPAAFGQGDLATTALAVDDDTIAVLDLHSGQLAYASVDQLTVDKVLRLPDAFLAAVEEMSAGGSDQPSVHMAIQGTSVAVGINSAVRWFDAATLEPLAGVEPVELPSPLLGLTTVSGAVLAWPEGPGDGPRQLTVPTSAT